MRIGTKLGMGFGAVLILMTGGFAIGVIELGSLNRTAEKMAASDWKKAQLTYDANGWVLQNATNTFRLLLATGAEERAAIWAEIDKNKNLITANFEKIEGLLYLAEGRKLMTEIKEARLPYVSSFTLVHELLEEGKTAEASRIAKEETIPRLGTFTEKMAELVTLQSKLVDVGALEAARAYVLARTILVSFAAVAIALGVLFSVLITVSITKPVLKTIDVLALISRGDLTVSLDHSSKDEIGQMTNSLKEMVQNLKKVVSEVAQSTKNVALGSRELSSTSQGLAQGASEQSSVAEETTSALEQISANIQQSAENAKQTDVIAAKAYKDMNVSGESVVSTVSSMKEIAGKIGIIEEIARKTDLLALNAAIEAAHAGDQGKGFAVVASEIRKLADRSKQAAAEITELVSVGVGVAENAGELLTKLVPDIRKTADLVQEISSASNEQNIGISQINKALQQLDQVIQQNATVSEEMASTAEELSSQAEILDDAISFFKVDVALRQSGDLPEKSVALIEHE